MCQLCVEYEKGKLTAKEAMRALGEMLHFAEDDTEVQHLFELANKIVDEEGDPFEEWDSDTNTGTLEELDDDLDYYDDDDCI